MAESWAVPHSAPRVRGLVRMPSLDGLRFVAVVLTSAVHLFPDRVPGGIFGVDMFFVLSGFLITVVLLTSMDAAGQLSFRAFYARRARRLLPALTVFLVTFAIWTLASGPSGYQVKVAAVVVATVLGYVYNWTGVLGHDPPWQVDHLWSLSVEEQFYLLWPLVLTFLIRRCRPRAVMVATASAAAVSAVAQTVAWVLTHDEHVVYLASPLRADGLLLGCLIAQLYVWDAAPVLWRWLARAWLLQMLAALGLLALALTVTQTQALTYLGGMAFAVLAAGVLVAGLAARESLDAVGPVLSRLLANRLVVSLGKRSYSIYLWQNAVAWALTTPLRHTWLWLPANLVTTLICAEVSYRFVEKPFLRRRLEPPTAQAPVTPEPARAAHS